MRDLHLLSSNTRVSQRANKEVKRLLHMAALTVLKMPDSEYVLYYKRKRKRVKTECPFYMRLDRQLLQGYLHV